MLGLVAVASPGEARVADGPSVSADGAAASIAAAILPHASMQAEIPLDKAPDARLVVHDVPADQASPAVPTVMLADRPLT